jgi:Fic family protein
MSCHCQKENSCLKYRLESEAIHYPIKRKSQRFNDAQRLLNAINEIQQMQNTQLIPNQPLALQLAKRDLSLLVYDAVNLEGVAMTLPEVQTILDGITVGGHKISDQTMAVNQAKTWELLFEMVKMGRFRFDKATVLQIHQVAGKDEALDWGKFRTGFVTIAGSHYEPPAPETLDKHWLVLETILANIPDIYDRAITAFLQMARMQFFWDVNKRTGRFMMNGILLAHGYPIINVPAKGQQAFNTLMLDFYADNNMLAMNTFLRSCLDQRLLRNFTS